MIRAIATALLLSVARGAPQEAGPLPLNVLWLTVEDMSPWIGPYGDTTVPTPRLDAFAAEALRYDNAFASSPVCAPARTALITGMDPTRIGAMHMRTRSRSATAGDEAYGDLLPYEAVPPHWVRCFPEILRRAGYYTSNCSKTDYQFVAPGTVWDQSSNRAHYSRRPAGSPFFAVFNHGGTHESQAFPEAKLRPEMVSAADVPVPPIYPDTPATRDALARTYNNIAAMDAWVGAQLDELEASGAADSTVVFFFSDHGVGLPRGKRSLYGTGTRVPLLVRFPKDRWPAGLRPGTATERVVSFVDFGPTVLSLAEVQPETWPRAHLDGRAFLGVHAVEPRKVAFAQADRFDAVYDRARSATDGVRLVVRNLMPEEPHLIANAYRERIPMTRDCYALRDGGARAWTRTPAQWQVGSTQRPPVEWYDRRSDPWEVRNLVNGDLPEAEQIAFAALESELDRWIEDTGDLGLVQPEWQMVAAHLWPEGVQPATEAPTFTQPHGMNWLTCRTQGASIGYRFSDKEPWRLLSSRVDFPDGVRELQAFAHRIGWKPSAVVTLGPDR